MEATNRHAIAIIGFSARAAAQCAIRQGFEVIAVDLCADRDLISNCHSHYRLDDPSWPDILDLLHPSVPLLFAGGMENRLELVDRCHSVAQRFGPTRKQLATLRSVRNWARWAVSSQVGWPVTLLDASTRSDISEQLLEGDWIVKPFQSAGGIGVIDLENASQWNGNFLAENSPVYLQQRLPGESIGVTFLSSEFGSTLLGAAAACESDLKPLQSDYVYRGSYGPIPLSTDQIEDLQRFAELVHCESGVHGLWQADFLLHERELTLLEINPRWSASMEILDVCLDLRLVELHYACISGAMSQAKFEILSTKACARANKPVEISLHKFIAYARTAFTVSASQSDSWWMNRWDGDLKSAIDRSLFADIPSAGTHIGDGHPIMSVMTTSNSVNFSEVY